MNTGHPYILEMEDLDMLKYWSERNHFFARKFDVNVDEQVLDEIDKRIFFWWEAFRKRDMRY